MFPMVELVEVARKTAGADAVLATDAELLEVGVAFEEVRRLVDAAQGHVLAQLEARGAVDAEFGLSANGWLAREARLPAGWPASGSRSPQSSRHYSIRWMWRCGTVGCRGTTPGCSRTRATRGWPRRWPPSRAS